MRAGRLLHELAGCAVTVFGAGREGLDLVSFLLAEGARVRLTDQKTADELGDQLAQVRSLEAASGTSVELSLGGHPTEVLAADVLFVSPGISPDTPILVDARQRRLATSSATELFFARCPAPIVGITGSSGKSTTTALVGAMLTSHREGVVVGGNIGTPLLGTLRSLTGDSLVVMELSSFQLETLEQSPWIATVTNVTPNHLDRHESMDAYICAKERIFRFQRSDDWTVLNADDPVSRTFNPPGRTAFFSLTRRVAGAYLEDGALILEQDGRARSVVAVDEIRLRGRHNLANALTACTTATLAGASLDAVRNTLRSFQGLSHRLQQVGTLQEVTFVDDSIATSPERSMAGLAAFDEPVVLLAGGRDKHLPMDDWATMMCQRARGVVLFGEARPLIRTALERAGYPRERVRESRSLTEAVGHGFELAEPGDVVLLSPGCTSYDQFRDFVERGHAFARAVQSLIRERS